MSRQTPDDFQPKFFEAVNLAHEKGKATISCPIQEAKNLRTYFYHFRKVLRNSDHPMAEKAADIKFTVDKRGLTLYPKGSQIPFDIN